MKEKNVAQYGFDVNGAVFNKTVQRLKKAFPRKKKDQEYLSVVFRATDTQVSISMPGAEVGLEADSFGHFSAAIPFHLFKDLCQDHYVKDKSYMFRFGPGLLSINGLSYRFPEIVFEAEVQPQASFTDIKKTANGNVGSPDVSPLGLPLLGIYYELKKYPPGTLTHPRFMKGQTDIEDILNKVDKLLKPLGLGRHTIEKLLDERKPIGPTHP